MTTTNNTYTRQDNPTSSYFHLPILLHPDQTAMDLLQHTQDTYRDACLDIVKFFEERNINIAVFEKHDSVCSYAGKCRLQCIGYIHNL